MLLPDEPSVTDRTGLEGSCSARQRRPTSRSAPTTSFRDGTVTSTAPFAGANTIQPWPGDMAVYADSTIRTHVQSWLCATLRAAMRSRTTTSSGSIGACIEGSRGPHSLRLSQDVRSRPSPRGLGVCRRWRPRRAGPPDQPTWAVQLARYKRLSTRPMTEPVCSDRAPVLSHLVVVAPIKERREPTLLLSDQQDGLCGHCGYPLRGASICAGEDSQKRRGLVGGRLFVEHGDRRGNDTLIWPHRDGLSWPRPRHSGAVMTV